MMAIASLVLSAVMTIDGLGAATQGASQGDYARPLMNACGANTTASVRPRDAIAHLLVRLGTERSESFLNVLENLRRSNVIVYVQVQQGPRVGTVAGSLRFTGAEGCFRWVLATVESGTTSFGSALRNVVSLTAF